MKTTNEVTHRVKPSVINEYVAEATRVQSETDSLASMLRENVIHAARLKGRGKVEGGDAAAVRAYLDAQQAAFPVRGAKVAAESEDNARAYRAYRNFTTTKGKVAAALARPGWAESLLTTSYLHAWAAGATSEGHGNAKGRRKAARTGGGTVTAIKRGVAVKGRTHPTDTVPEDQRAALAALDAALSEAQALKLVSGEMARGIMNAATANANAMAPKPEPEAPKAPRRRASKSSKSSKSSK